MVSTVLINVITRPFSHILTLMKISCYVLMQDVSLQALIVFRDSRRRTAPTAAR
jgi:hypothetical protein